MPAFCLGTSAILTLRDDEPGAERVAMLLEGTDPCFACFVTRMEALYRVWKDEGERSGRLAYEQLQSLPIQWVDQTEPLLLAASLIKASHPLSIAGQCRCIRIRNLRPSLNWIRVGWPDCLIS